MNLHEIGQVSHRPTCGDFADDVVGSVVVFTAYIVLTYVAIEMLATRRRTQYGTGAPFLELE